MIYYMVAAVLVQLERGVGASMPGSLTQMG